MLDRHMQTGRKHFYPRSPRGERPAPCSGPARPGHFYPRSPRGERPVWALDVPQAVQISIHAPREGSDRNAAYKLDGHTMISIHAPREGSDESKPLRATLYEIFLSTLPARGATVAL